MRTLWQRWRWSAVVAGAGLILALWLGNHGARWMLLGVHHLEMLFADAAALLAAGEAHSAGLNAYQAPNHFDPGLRPHIYGPGWLVLGDLGLTVTDTPWFGLLISGGFFFAMVRLFRPHTLGAAACTALALFSPPVLLGINRANNDLLMVVLVMAAAWLAGRRERIAPNAATVLLGAGALLKIYPLAAWPALLALPGRGWRWARLMMPLALVALYAFWQWRAYAAALSQVPADKTIFAFDAAYACQLALGGVRTLRIWTWLGTLLALLVLARCARGHARNWAALLPLQGPWALLTVASGCIWTFSLLAASNYPYRAVWLLPLVAYAWRHARTLGGHGLAILLTMLFWSGRLMDYLHTRVEQLGPAEQTPVWAASIGFAEAFTLISLGVTLWLLTGWAWRSWQRLRAGE